MMKKRLLIPVAATMMVISVFTAGAVMAQEDGTGETPAAQSFASRVAAILGLEEAQVQDAMDQAHREMQDEALRNRLDALVEQGRLTQEQADEYHQWYQSRPEGIRGFGGPGPGFRFGGLGHGHGHGHRMKGPEGMFGAPRDLAPSQDNSGIDNTTSF
jgi:hypothetical protein